jgi:hypothetical protein
MIRRKLSPTFEFHGSGLLRTTSSRRSSVVEISSSVRHLMEEHHLGEKIFNALNELLEANGCMMRGGTIGSFSNTP